MDVLTALQASLGDQYRLERELGGGGMSRVFVATEVALQRRVVIKVLGRELAQGLSTERFEREIALAARLQDPHIVPVYTAGVTNDGLPYFTMPFVVGETLRARLDQGPVPVDDALRILRDVAEALEYAHARGVVHRDIKPENVLLSGRSAVVADFGIAKALTAARTRADELTTGTLTSVGMSLGTPAYMAPEQAAGDPGTDHRADLYAWGLLAYEVLAGTHPFAGRRTPQQLLAAHLAELPKPLAEAKPALPPALATLVMQCLAKSPDERPGDATALLSLLADASRDTITSVTRPAVVSFPARGRRMRAIAVAACVLVLGTTGVFVARRAATSHREAAAAPSIAVLPFVHEGDTATAYVTDGITDDIRSKLMGVRDLVVIARASSDAYRATKKTPPAIAEELGVRYLLTGSVRVVGIGADRRVLVRPELVEITADGRSQARWGQPFDVPGADLAGLQGTIGEKVVGAMEVAVGGADRQRLVGVPTRDAAAYDLFLRARAATEFGADRSVQALTTAQTLLEESVQRDSSFVEAWGELALVRADRFNRWTPLPELGEGARQAAERTKALDPNGGRGDRAMGIYLLLVRLDAAGAALAQERAYRESPNEAAVANNLAIMRATQGRLDEALRLYTSALRLDPRNVSTLSNLANLLRRMQRLADARTQTARLQRISPTSPSTLRQLMEDALYAGDTVAARRILAEALRTGAPERLLPGVLQSPSQSPLLDPSLVQAELKRGPESVGGDTATWHFARAMHAWLRGDSLAARSQGDSAQRLLARRMKEFPNDGGMRLVYSYNLAFAGRREDALREVRAGLAQLLQRGFDKRSTEYFDGLYGGALAAAVAGAYDAALDLLEEQRTLPMHLSPGRIRVNPFLAPLRGDKRFQRLIADEPR
jgi:serine/threonine-protein kinase